MSRTIDKIMDTDLNPTAYAGPSDNIAGLAADAQIPDDTEQNSFHSEKAREQTDGKRLSLLGQNVGNKERLVSLVGGSALALYGLRRGSKVGYTLAAAGLGLAARGATGHCGVYGAMKVNTAPPEPEATTVDVKAVITIGRPPEEIYRFWRNFENLPRFMDHLESVTVDEDGTSHWVAKAPLGRSVSWDAEIMEEEPATHICWRSLPGSQIMNDGMVIFKQAPGGRGTEVHVTLTYQPPAGQLGRAIALMTGEEPKMQIKNDLLRLKRLLETGEIATAEGQPHGERSIKGRLLNKREG